VFHVKHFVTNFECFKIFLTYFFGLVFDVKHLIKLMRLLSDVSRETYFFF